MQQGSENLVVRNLIVIQNCGYVKCVVVTTRLPVARFFREHIEVTPMGLKKDE